MEAWSRRLLDAPGVDHVTAYVLAVSEDKHYADLAGTTATQRGSASTPRSRLSPCADGGGFEAMRTVAPPAGRGWEYLEGEGWDWEAELAGLPELLAAKLAAPSVEAGPYDLVIDPTNLWLTIHESVGHATELDRALGYEAAYAGTSFATSDQLGLPALRVPAHARHRGPHDRARPGHRGHRRRGGRGAVLRPGARRGARRLPARPGHRRARPARPRSNGCAFADSPLHVPIQRMANVSLQPAEGEGPTTEDLIAGVERGIYVVGDKSWSIDMQRYNFQFTGQRFFRIDDGRLAGQVRDVAYQATTTDFWGSLAAASAVGPPTCSPGPSTAARASPARWPRSATAARRPSSSRCACSTPARSPGR